MSITDELRTGGIHSSPSNTRHFLEEELTAIADRIDAEHDKALNSVDDAYDSGYNVGYDEGFASADDWLAQHEDAMAEHGWIRLPKDADGVPIHVGDVMCGYGWPNGGVYCRAIVNEVTILVGPQDGAYRGWLMWATNECRHYHALTVEDVLFDSLKHFGAVEERTPEVDKWLHEQAKRLKLAEGEDA